MIPYVEIMANIGCFINRNKRQHARVKHKITDDFHNNNPHCLTKWMQIWELKIRH